VDWSTLEYSETNCGRETNTSDAAGAATLLALVRTKIRSLVSGVRIQHSYLSVLSGDCWGGDILHSFHGTDGMGPRRGKGGRVNVRLN